MLSLHSFSMFFAGERAGVSDFAIGLSGLGVMFALMLLRMPVGMAMLAVEAALSLRNEFKNRKS